MADSYPHVRKFCALRRIAAIGSISKRGSHIGPRWKPDKLFHSVGRTPKASPRNGGPITRKRVETETGAAVAEIACTRDEARITTKSAPQGALYFFAQGTGQEKGGGQRQRRAAGSARLTDK